MCIRDRIYAGTLRRIPEHLTYRKVLQSEISRFNRRCCDPYRLMYAALELRTRKMLSSILSCMRKSRDSNDITAGQLLNYGFVNNLKLKDHAHIKFSNMIVVALLSLQREKKFNKFLQLNDSTN